MVIKETEDMCWTHLTRFKSVSGSWYHESELLGSIKGEYLFAN